MTDAEAVAALARDLVRIDSRSSLTNLPVAERLEAELPGFEIERLDYTDAAGVAKRALVAHRGPLSGGGLALSGHMDTVPETGWTEDPWSGRVDDAGILHGLGAADMKGPVAAIVVAARGLPADIPVTLLLTTDEETTKQGARIVAQRSDLARRAAPRGIVVAEPTGLVPVRGHRANVMFTATARGIQAHSSGALGVNANWALIPFLAEMREVFARLRSDPALQDPAYDPPFSDFNLLLDNHGTAVNVTVPLATARIKFRYSRSIDPTPVVAAVQAAADRAGLALEIQADPGAPELPEDHPLVAMAVRETGQAPRTAAYGTDATELQALAPCLVLGPGTITVAHSPGEHVPLAELVRAVPLFRRLVMAG
ncbi:M20/M25/M40 family metallo-hydrolase [Roseomonas gilardii subsp. gilardii]|uniref:M20/M25/M40 family metallo-hydrolase n=1 Tax=Roseomonas gilardii TaxID=257708 RepID=UPI001FF82C7A|nr:M20/M25/M40 family metallo-hydrolase [Roseomonas gilardii]UPG72094.1 M20/M25/M40 family metallo-hydrolase [Roseomonas gilardii subsp. gilardii]